MSRTLQSGETTPSLQTKTLRLYKPHAKQLDFHNLNKRFRVAAWGRQSGKSTACSNEIARHMWSRPGTAYWFISPTFDQAKKQYRRFVGMFQSCWQILLKKNQTELRVKFINQSTVEFKSGEVFDNLRGETLDGCVIDEMREQSPDLFKLVVRPMLATRRGWCTFISTPNGEDHFFELAERAKIDSNWGYTHTPSTANPLFTQQEYEEAKLDMSEPEFAQEIMAEFRDLTRGKAYGSYSVRNERMTSPFTDNGLVHKNLPVYLCCDFNMAPMAWTLVQGAVKNFYAFDMIYIPKTQRGTEEASKVLTEKLQEYNIESITIVGDATGKANKTSAAGQTDYAIICAALDRAKITWENLTPESNPPVKDRVNCFNAHLEDANGAQHFWLHPVNCKPLRLDLQKTTWKEKVVGKLDAGPKNLYTHASDGVGYLLHAVDPLQLFEDSFDLRII